MHFLFDFIPVVVFFTAYKFADIYVATAAAMIASSIQILVAWLMHKKVEKTPLITLAILLILGGATLLFHDEAFIKWKPTVIYLMISCIVLGKRLWNNTSICEQLLGEKVVLDAVHWRFIDQVTMGFFSFMAVLNWWVASTFDTTTWVHFKLFGVLGLMLIYCLALSCYMAKYAEEIESNEPV